jgi:hypothetical protein
MTKTFDGSCFDGSAEDELAHYKFARLGIKHEMAQAESRKDWVEREALSEQLQMIDSMIKELKGH